MKCSSAFRITKQALDILKDSADSQDEVRRNKLPERIKILDETFDKFEEQKKKL